MGPAHDEITHASNAVGDAGNVVGMVLDFPTNVTCRVPAQCGLEGSTSRMRACDSRWRTRNSWLTCTVHTSTKQIHGVLLLSGFMTVVSSHVRKAVRVVVVVQWLSEWDVVSSDG